MVMLIILVSLIVRLVYKYPSTFKMASPYLCSTTASQVVVVVVVVVVVALPLLPI